MSAPRRNKAGRGDRPAFDGMSGVGLFSVSALVDVEVFHVHKVRDRARCPGTRGVIQKGRPIGPKSSRLIRVGSSMHAVERTGAAAAQPALSGRRVDGVDARRSDPNARRSHFRGFSCEDAAAMGV